MAWRSGVSERSDAAQGIASSVGTADYCETQQAVLEVYLRRAATNELFRNECIFLIPSRERAPPQRPLHTCYIQAGKSHGCNPKRPYFAPQLPG